LISCIFSPCENRLITLLIRPKKASLVKNKFRNLFNVEVRRASETRRPREAKPLAAGVNEAAKLLRLSSVPIRLYVARGWIRSVRIGRRVLIPMEVLEKVMVEGLVRGEA